MIYPGLLRAIDPDRKLFYLTTPLSGSNLDLVNVLVLGNPDEVDLKPTASTAEPKEVSAGNSTYTPIEFMISRRRASNAHIWAVLTIMCVHHVRVSKYN